MRTSNLIIGSRLTSVCSLQTIVRIIVFVAIVLKSLQPIGGVTLGESTANAWVQDRITAVGILAFQDETDSGGPTELGRKIAQQIKQRLSLSFNDVVPKWLSSESAMPLSVEQAVALGKQNAVQFVVRGGLLVLAVDDHQQKVNARLYAEIFSVESGTVSLEKADGSGTGTGATAQGIQWSAVDLNAPGFASTAPGNALATAIDSLAKSIHESISAPAPGAGEVSDTGADPALSNESSQAADTAAAEADEELQQLVSQAEEFVAGSSGQTERLRLVRAALEKLRSALTSKASQLEAGAKATAADDDITTAKTELHAALESATEATASAEPGSTEPEAPTGEKKGLLGSINRVATEALGILQKIQEMRAAVRSVNEGVAVPEGAPDTIEEPTEDVTGVVTENGQPVAGVEVSDADSEVSAVSGPDGSYLLKGLPAGKLSKLTLKKNGKPLGGGQIDIGKGRTAIADFDVTSKPSPQASPLRIIPSSIVLKTLAESTGTIKGIARDKDGKPLARALVQLQGLGVIARTDSAGQYAFYRVPAGKNAVKVQPVGMKGSIEPVLVTSYQTSTVQSRLVAMPKSETDRPRAMVRGSRATLRGRVSNTEGKPLAGAKILALQSGIAVSVLTSLNGEYALKDLEAGAYTVLATKAGYETGKLKVGVNVGEGTTQSFRLKEQDSPYVARAMSAQSLRQSSREPARVSATPPKSSAVPVRSSVIPARTSLTAAGELVGRVLDAATGRPIAGATVSIGVRSIKTSEAGSFSLPNLVPGAYHISVSSAGFSKEQREVAIRSGANSREDFALKRTPTTFNPGATRTQAAPVAQTPVARLQVGQLRGRVTDAGVPIAGAVVAMSGGHNAVTGRDGSFTINTLTPGSYQVVVRKTGFADRRDDVRIKQGEVTNVTFSLMSVVRRSKR